MLSILRSESGLVRQVLKGHSAPFDELVKRHFSMVYGVAFSYTRNHADAEDLSQEVFIKAYQKLDTLDDRRKFGHWVSVIARNLGRTWFQRKTREAEIKKELTKEPINKNNVLYDDLREILELQINKLDPVPREVLMLHYFSGKSTADIAKTMDVSQVAILKRLQRAREALGAKLINELKVIPPAELDTKKHRRTIMNSIIASGLIWKLGGSGIATAAVGVLTSGKAIATGIVLIGVTTSFALLPSQGNEPNNTGTINQHTSSIEYQIPNEIVAIEAMDKVTNIQENSTGVSSKSINKPQSIVLLAEASTEDSIKYAPESLKGDWLASMTDINGNTIELGWAKLIRTVDTFTIQGMNEISADLLSEGIVNGFNVQLIVKSKTKKRSPQILPNGKKIAGSIQNIEHEIGSFKGEFSTKFDSVKLTGELTLYGSLNKQTLRFQKQPQHVKEKADNIALAKDKLQEIRGEIIRYFHKEKVMPEFSDLLTKKILSDPDVLGEESHETISYEPVPSEFIIPDFGMNTKARKYSNLLQETKDPSYLLLWEDELKKDWGDTFINDYIALSEHKILKLKNTQYDFILELAFGGSFAPPHHNKNREAFNRPDIDIQSKTRATCLNHMKQLGLVFKMFQNECPGEFIPAGFRQTFPEYMSDIKVLVCPGRQYDGIGYEVLFPASNELYWKEIYIQVEGVEATNNKYMASVPWLIEKVDCSESGGRNVLFADGHAEFVTDEDWEIQIAPFMKYAYK